MILSNKYNEIAMLVSGDKFQQSRQQETIDGCTNDASLRRIGCGLLVASCLNCISENSTAVSEAQDYSSPFDAVRI